MTITVITATPNQYHDAEEAEFELDELEWQNEVKSN